MEPHGGASAQRRTSGPGPGQAPQDGAQARVDARSAGRSGHSRSARACTRPCAPPVGDAPGAPAAAAPGGGRARPGRRSGGRSRRAAPMPRCGACRRRSSGLPVGVAAAAAVPLNAGPGWILFWVEPSGPVVRSAQRAGTTQGRAGDERPHAAGTRTRTRQGGRTIHRGDRRGHGRGSVVHHRGARSRAPHRSLERPHVPTQQELQSRPSPSGPDALFAAKLQEVLGGQFGEMTVMMQYLFQGWNCRGPASTRT